MENQMTEQEYQKWQMELVTAAEMAETGLSEQEVVRLFGARAEQETDNEKAEREVQFLTESWTDDAWHSMAAALELPTISNTALSPKVFVDDAVERAYRKFALSAEQLCEECAGAEWDWQTGFIEAVLNRLRIEHDSGHLMDMAGSGFKALTTLINVCEKSFENLENQGTVYGDLFSAAAQAAGELRDVMAKSCI